MKSGPKVEIERQGATLVVRMSNQSMIYGALFAGFALFVLAGFASSSGWSRLWAVLPLAFVVIGVGLMLPHVATTVFDLGKKRVHLRRVVLNWCLHERVYSFEEIAGVGLKEYNSDGYSYSPVLVMRDGSTKAMAVLNGGSIDLGKAIDEICSVTGMSRVDIPS